MDLRKQGLTLLEVLAAFLIFSMVFTVLVGSSQSGVRSQGLSIRRLQAHEIAESALAELEIAMLLQKLPSVDEEESEHDGFILRIQEMPFIPEQDPGPSSTDSLSTESSSDILSQLAAQLPEVGKFMMRYEIEVEWTEATRPEKITRTTFAFDWEAAQTEYASLFEAGGGKPAGSTDDRDGDSSDDDSSSKDENKPRSKSEKKRRSEQGDTSQDNSDTGSGDSLQQQKEELKRAFQRFLDSRGGE